MIARVAQVFSPVQSILPLLLACSVWWPLSNQQRCHGAEPDDAMVKKVLDLWSKRRRLVKTAIWECKGREVMPRGWCDPVDPPVQGASERHYPEEDFE